MELSITQMVCVSLAILIGGIVVGRFVKRNKDGESVLARIFKDNKDFDSTIDRIGIITVIVFMMVSFHDDLDTAQIGMVILAAINLWQAIVLGKAINRQSQTIETIQTNGHNGGQK